MTQTIDLDALFKFAAELHGSQKDKSGLPYWTHLAAVWQNVIDLGGGVEVQAAAILHDSVEDTSMDEDDLDALMPVRVADAVMAVTKRKGEENTKYIGRVIEAGRDAMLVKLADLYHNTDPDRLATLPAYTVVRLKAKYYDAIYRLEKELHIKHTITLAQRDEAVKANGGRVGSASYGTTGDWDDWATTWEPGRSYHYPKYSKEPVHSTAVGLPHKQAKETIVGDEVIGYGTITSMRRDKDGTHIITFTKDGVTTTVTCAANRQFYMEKGAK